MSLDDLTGKVALVTGANRGIGRAVALALAEAASLIPVGRFGAADEVAVVDVLLARNGYYHRTDGERERRLVYELVPARRAGGFKDARIQGFKEETKSVGLDNAILASLNLRILESSPPFSAVVDWTRSRRRCCCAR